jgi:SAM-dependent methyltransferase/uncharacterized protein YbaR (Trm112 family)
MVEQRTPLADVRLEPAVVERLRCPVCRAGFEQIASEFHCVDEACATTFPIVDGVPVLLNESNSIFTTAELVESRRPELNRQAAASRGRRLRRRIKRAIPSTSKNLNAAKNCATLAQLLVEQNDSPRLLVLGGGLELGRGMDALAQEPRIEIVESNVSFGPRTVLICDAHDVPFEDDSFDGVIVQAVLEHVADPYRCVEEIHRVLKPDGLVFAETPFMQQVHMGRYDFTRFTHLGHRRLFRNFAEVESGPACGPGMALAWSFQYFLVSFPRSRVLRSVLWNVGSALAFPLKHLDPFLATRPGGYDAASGYYFIGRKNDHALSDRELISLYRGAIT